MSDEFHDVEATLKELGRTSKLSFALLVVGAIALIGSLIYSATRLEPLEQDIQQKKTEIAELSQHISSLKAVEDDYLKRIEAARLEFETLRGNIEKLYAVRVTPSNQVYELKATAKATEHTSSSRAIYDFRIYINAPAETLDGIQSVTYLFDHPTFREKRKTTENSRDNFMTRYFGWGCLTKVTATLQLKDGSRQEIDFNMCQSLGPMWSSGNESNGPTEKNAATDGPVKKAMPIKRSPPSPSLAREKDLIDKLNYQAEEAAQKLPPR